MNLKNKHILLFAPSFFGYELQIRDRLAEMGAVVDFYDERPSNNVYVKVFVRYLRAAMRLKIKRHYQKIYNNIKTNNYDYVLAINIEAMPYEFVLKMKERFTKTKFIHYIWDSIAYKPRIVKYIDLFDKTLSFDKDDCILYPQIKFRPLFFLNQYREVAKERDYKYDISFAGTGKADRHLVLQRIKDVLCDRNLIFYFYIYLQSKRALVMHKLTNANFRQSKVSDFNYIPLSNLEVLNIFRSSKIVVDIEAPNQRGLTIRTIEIVGAKRKLITTNRRIEEYDFYNTNNILIVDRDNPSIPNSFLETDYIEISEDIYNRYSLDAWLEELFA